MPYKSDRNFSEDIQNRAPGPPALHRAFQNSPSQKTVKPWPNLTQQATLFVFPSSFYRETVVSKTIKRRWKDDEKTMKYARWLVTDQVSFRRILAPVSNRITSVYTV